MSRVVRADVGSTCTQNSGKTFESQRERWLPIPINHHTTCSGGQNENESKQHHSNGNDFLGHDCICGNIDNYSGFGSTRKTYCNTAFMVSNATGHSSISGYIHIRRRDVYWPGILLCYHSRKHRMGSPSGKNPFELANVRLGQTCGSQYSHIPRPHCDDNCRIYWHHRRWLEGAGDPDRLGFHSQRWHADCGNLLAELPSRRCPVQRKRLMSLSLITKTHFVCKLDIL